jgi:hypothetical protein
MKGNFADPVRSIYAYERQPPKGETEKNKEYQKEHYQNELNTRILSTQAELRKRMRICTPQVTALD